MEPPSDPNQRKADMISCPRWILASLQKERQNNKALEAKLGSLAVSTPNDTVKRMMIRKEEEFQESQRKVVALQNEVLALSEVVPTSEKSIEELKKWKNLCKSQDTAMKQRRAESNEALTKLQTRCASVIKEKDEKIRLLELQVQEKPPAPLEDIGALKDQITSLQQALGQKKTEFFDQQDTIIGLEEKVRNKERRLATANTEISNLAKKVTKMQELLLRLQKQQQQISRQDVIIHEQKAELLKRATSEESKRKLLQEKVAEISKLKKQNFKLKKVNTIRKLPSSDLATLLCPLWEPSDTKRVPSPLPSSLVTWSIANLPSDVDIPETNTFLCLRKEKQSSLPDSLQKQKVSIPEAITKQLVIPGYVEKLIVRKDLEIFKSFMILFDSDSEYASGAMTHLFLYSGDQELTLEIVKYVITVEIDKTLDVNTLFRGNSMSSKVMSKYSRMIGIDYLRSVLGPVFNTIKQTDTFELNEDRINPKDPQDMQGNIGRVRNLLQDIFDAILGSKNRMPPQFLILCKCLFEQVRAKFPDHPYFGVVNFIFLRFFCVGVAAGQSFQIPCPLLSTPNVKRGLILVSKIIQCLANGTTLKEPFMICYNSWISEHKKALISFFKSITEDQIIPLPESFVVPQFITSKEETTKTIHSLLKAKKTEILAQIPKELDVETHGHVRIFVKELFPLILAPLKHKTNYMESDPQTTFFLQFFGTNEALMAAIAELSQSVEIRARDALASSVFTLFASVVSPNDILKIVEYWSDIEIDMQGSLMDNSMAAKVVTKYFQVHARNITHFLLGDLIHQLVTHSVHLEIDDDRMTEAELLAKKENTETLLRISHAWIEKLKERIIELPREVWQIFNFFVQKDEQFVGSIFLSSFVAPALQNPISFDLLKERPLKKVNRSLKVLSEVFLHIANDSLYYQPGDTYSAINAFTQEQTTSFILFMRDWATIPPKSTSSKIQVLSSVPTDWTILSAEMKVLITFLTEKEADIQQYLGDATMIWPMSYNIKQLTENALE